MLSFVLGCCMCFRWGLQFNSSNTGLLIRCTPEAIQRSANVIHLYINVWWGRSLESTHRSVSKPSHGLDTMLSHSIRWGLSDTNSLFTFTADFTMNRLTLETGVTWRPSAESESRSLCLTHVVVQRRSWKQWSVLEWLHGLRHGANCGWLHKLHDCIVNIILLQTWTTVETVCGSVVRHAVDLNSGLRLRLWSGSVPRWKLWAHGENCEWTHLWNLWDHGENCETTVKTVGETSMDSASSP